MTKILWERFVLNLVSYFLLNIYRGCFAVTVVRLQHAPSQMVRLPLDGCCIFKHTTEIKIQLGD